MGFVSVCPIGDENEVSGMAVLLQHCWERQKMVMRKRKAICQGIEKKKMLAVTERKLNWGTAL